VHRFYVPGSRCIGGRFVWLVNAPGLYEDGGALAEPTAIRGVAIPAGAELFYDWDFGGIDVTLHAPLVIRGVALGAGVTLHFPSRRILLVRTPWWTVPIILVLLPVLIVLARRRSRDISVSRDRTRLFTIRPDGSTTP
jgi:hypothetical protein